MRNKLYIIFIILTMIASVGCSDKKSGTGGGGNNFTDVPGGDDIPPVTDPDPSLTATAGATVDLIITDKSALDDYVGWTTNTPTESKIVVNLKKYITVARAAGGFDYGFGGYVSVKFKDNGSSYTDVFSSMWMGGYPTYNTVKDNAANHKYNLLSADYPELQGQVGYHGFFEATGVQRLIPPYYGQTIFSGAIIFVIDSTIDLGDGGGPSGANGSVWYKNIIAQYPMGPLPYTNCWFITAGPYDCRSWRQNGAVSTKDSIYPNAGYVKLGNFYNLDMKKAFNNQI